ncbi:MAG: T9SS type A sorting domain-containing protein [Flavobacteriales bacterium]|nr:T9SS type A sorting domain-containing protein [Flavobacteriales bacterium]
MKPNRRLLAHALALAVPLCTWAQTETEPNNAWNQNNPVAEESSMSGSSGTCSPTDNSVDYFALALTQVGQLKIRTSMSNDGPTSGVSLALYDKNVGQIASFNLASGVNGASALDSIVFTCRGTGTYYLRLNAPAIGCLSYTFSYEILPPVFGADTENNNNWNTANTDTVAVNTNADGRINFSQNDDNSDFFILELDDDGILNVHIQAEHVDASTGDSLTVRLYNSSVALQKTWRVGIGANSTPLASTVSIPCRGNEQRYFLQFASDACGTSYRFSYDVTPPVFADDNGDNYNWNSPNTDTVAVGADQDGRLNFNYDDNSDYHILTLDDDGILNVHIQAEQVDASTGDSLTLTLYNSSAQLLKTWRVGVGANSTPLDSTVHMTCRGNEARYFLKFASDACGTSYRFSYDVTSPVYADDNGDNYNWNSPNTDTVAVSTDADGRLNFYYDDNSDYHILTLDDDGILNVHIQSEHVDASTADSLTVRLYNTSNGLLQTWRVGIGANSTPLDSTIHMTCRGNEQRYFLQFASDACGTSYRFSYDVTSPMFADDNEDNDNWNYPNTDTIFLDSAAVTGRLAFYYDDNSDFYKVVLTTAGTITVDSRAENANAAGTYDVHLYNSNVNQIATHTYPVGGSSTPASDTWTSGPLAAGTYYLRATNAPCGTSYSFLCNDEDDDGVCNGFDLCPGTPNGEGVNANGCSCSQVTVDDGDPCTLDECLNGDVTHTFQDADGDLTCDANDGCPNDANKTAPGACGCGNPDVPTTWYADADGDGLGDPNNSIAGYTCIQPPGYVSDNTDGCPSVTGTVGSACDDGNPNTTGDALDASCNCVGTPMGCDDGDPCTLDTWDGFQCVHTFQDADGDGTCDANDGCVNDPDKTAPGACGCGNPDVPTTWFADADGDGFGDPNTSQAGFTCIQPPGYVADNTDHCDGDVNKTDPGACGCGVADVATTWYADTDGDGLGDPNNSQAGFTCIQPPGYVADNTDLCPAVTGTVGSACDDGNPNTTGDAIDANCNCVGTPNGGPCTGNQVVVNITTDANPAQLSWEIRDGGNVLVASGTPATPNGLNSETACLGSVVESACYSFKLLDSFGDGLAGAGGWELRTTDGKLVLRDDFANGSVSPATPTASPSYGSGHSFCLPLGSSRVMANECNVFTNGMYDKVYCSKVTGATQYQFEFSDPDAGFIRRIARPHNYVVFYEMVSSPLVPGVVYFTRVRTNEDGPLASAHWGSGCDLGLGIAQVVQCTQLIQAPAYGHSCNETRSFIAPYNYLYAKPVTGATTYTFKITGDDGNYNGGIEFVRNTYILALGWGTGEAPALTDQTTYQVQVRVTVNGIEGTYCGNSCNVTIDNNPGLRPRLAQTEGQPEMSLWPNPNNGQHLNVAMGGLNSELTTADVRLMDLTGRVALGTQLNVLDGAINSVIELSSTANGTYLLQIIAGGNTYTKRVVVSK